VCRWWWLDLICLADQPESRLSQPIPSPISVQHRGSRALFDMTEWIPRERDRGRCQSQGRVQTTYPLTYMCVGEHKQTKTQFSPLVLHRVRRDWE
jgi:hypothetical protein